MKKRWFALIVVMSMLLPLLGTGQTFAADEETVTVPVTVTSLYDGKNDWENATYTCVYTDGVPAESGILSNGKYSFMYFPATGEIKKNAQTDNGFFFNGAVMPTVVIPWKIAEFSISSPSATAETHYDPKEITISATSYVYPFNTLSDDVQVLAFSEGIETIAPNSLYGIPYTNEQLVIKLPSTLKAIGSGAFCASGSKGAVFNEIVIPDGVTSVGATAFGLNRFASCTFPAGVTELPKNIFQNCIRLEEVTLKGSVTSIGEKAFSGCHSLKTLTFEGKNAPSSITAGAFGSVSGLTVRYPANGIGYDSASFRSALPEDTIFEPFAVKPTVLGISLTGSPLVGDTLLGRYESFVTTDGSTESGSTATWYRADDSNFTQNIETIETKPISAGETLTYTLTDADEGKYIRFSVIPRSSAPDSNVGDETSAVLAEKVRRPQTVPIVTILSPRDGYKIYVGNDIQLTASAICDNTTIEKVEYYANGELCGASSTAPYTATWSGAPVGDYIITARAYNALGEQADSPAVHIRVADLSERTEPVWAEKWSYDFSAFTTEEVYDNSTGLTFPGEQPPAISISTGGTVQSAHGLFEKAPDDYHLQINSVNGQMTPATLKFDLAGLDKPIKNIVAEADVAFSSTDESRYLFGYTARLTYYPLVFNNKGLIQYTTSTGTYTFKDKEGKDLTYQPNRWYHAAVKFDMTTQSMEFYLDGEKLETVDNLVPEIHYFKDITQIFIEGRHSTSQTGVMYIDNPKISQEQDSYVTSVLTAPKTGYSLKGTDIQFAGYAKDSTGREISKVEFYANAQKIAEKDGGSYNFTLSDLPCGSYDIYALAISESGEQGISETVQVVVDGITLPHMYADGMLLQRNKPIRIAGTGIDGVTVCALLNGSQSSTTVKNGRWQLILPAQPAAKNTTLTISSSEGAVHVFSDVAIGELIMCTGQSNMAYSLGAFKNLLPQADKTYEDIRLFVQPEDTSSTPQTDIPDGYWTAATPQEATYYSAMAFLTARDYYLSQGGEVPVGCIKGSIGGTSISGWVPSAGYDNDPDLAKIKSDIRGKMGINYNRMIHPWTNYTIGTVFWYQGEADTLLTNNYEKMLSAFIDSWQEAWKDQLNFIIVQLPIYNYMTAYKAARSAAGVREGQFNVSETYDNVETVVGVDTGDATGIHPPDKEALVHRSSLILQHFTHPEDTGLVWKSPSFDHFEQNGNTMTLYFKDTADGLKTTDGAAPRGFKISGDDGKFVDATATLSGSTITIDTSGVTGTPKVRYAWEDSPALDSEGKHTTLNLVNSADLPMAPFRTDRDRYNFKSIDLSDYTLYDPVNFAPAILSVTADAVIQNGQTTITVRAKDYDDDVARVEVYADDTLLGEAQRKDGTDTFLFQWKNPTPGAHTLYAVAFDTADATSVKQSPTLGDKTVAPQKYPVTIKESTPYSLLPFENLSGEQINHFAGEDGVTAKAESTGDTVLMIAAYDQNGALLKVKTAEANTVSFTAAELSGAAEVKAFLLSGAEEARPLVPSAGIPAV